MDFLSEEKQQQKLLRYCLRLTRSTAEAKDLAQDVNERIIIRFKEGKLEEITGAYLSLTAHSLFIDGKRKATVKKRTIGEVSYLWKREISVMPLPELQEKKTTITRILNCSKYLSDSERAVLLLRWYTDKQFKEMAAERGLNTNSLLTSSFNAINKLRAEFEENNITCQDLSDMLKGDNKIPEGIENINIELTSRGRRPKRKVVLSSNTAICTI